MVSWVIELVQFVETRYSAEDSTIDKELLNPVRLGIRQVALACADAGRIAVLTNENEIHFEAGSPLTMTLSRIIDGGSLARMEFVVPTPAIGTKLHDLLEIPMGQFSLNARSVVDTTTIIVVKGDSVRAFSFTNISIEELNAGDARTLWEMARSRHSGFVKNPS
jgi:hypothetical protein